MLKVKKYLKLKKLGKRYEYEGSNDAVLFALYMFLDECYSATLRKLINDPNVKRGGMNETHWRKEDNKIIITFLAEEENAFETTIEELIRILNHWDKLRKKMPKEIVITRYDDTVILEEKN